MTHEVTVSLLPPLARLAPALLLVGFETTHLIFRVDHPERLAHWLAFIFEHRDEPDAMTPPLSVGRFGAHDVEFVIDGDNLLLVVCTEESTEEIVPSFSLYIPRDYLDDLADGLAHEHRQWVELPAV